MKENPFSVIFKETKKNSSNIYFGRPKNELIWIYFENKLVERLNAPKLWDKGQYLYILTKPTSVLLALKKKLRNYRAIEKHLC